MWSIVRTIDATIIWNKHSCLKNVVDIYSIMSIATLKRKTATKYNNMSVDVPRFSIIGGTRNQGWVGQGVRSRTIPPTRMRGDTQRGNGGCCGTYNEAPLVKGLCTNDPQIMKPASLSNYGMLQTKYRWVRRPRPFTSVKPGAGNILYRSSDEYIQRKARAAVCPKCVVPDKPSPPACNNCNTAPLMFQNWLNTPQSFAQPYPNATTKTDPSELSIANTQGEYLRSLDSCCNYLDVEFLDQENQTNIRRTPFACTCATCA